MATRIDALVRRFHTDRLTVSGHNRFDVAVAFVAPRIGELLRHATVLDVFRHTDTGAVFAPLDRFAEADVNDCVCYVLQSSRRQDFVPIYCPQGATRSVVQHYRIEFESLLRTLTERGYRYLMKPVHASRQTSAASSSTRDARSVVSAIAAADCHNLIEPQQRTKMTPQAARRSVYRRLPLTEPAPTDSRRTIAYGSTGEPPATRAANSLSAHFVHRPHEWTSLHKTARQQATSPYCESRIRHLLTPVRLATIGQTAESPR